ncbi:MAG: glycosyltransferase [Bacilli bacterium]|nr:glycosyltransferase [Bacilli bacterium]
MSKTSVIVLNYNDKENTKRIVADYQTMKCLDHIVIVDNCSKDDSYKELKKLENKKVRVIEAKENRGYAAGNNFGIQYIKDHFETQDYYIISNPDIYIEEEAIQKCINYLNTHKNVAIVAPKMLNRNGDVHPLFGWKHRTLLGDIIESSRWLSEIKKKPKEAYDKKVLENDEVLVDCIPGSFFVIQARIFEKIGYFDENTFLYYEEDIIAKKIKKLGYQEVILSKYSFKHMEGTSVNNTLSFMKKYIAFQKSKMYYHKNYNEKSNFIGLGILWLVTKFRYVEELLTNIYYKIKNFILTYGLKIYKLLILFIALLSLPIYKILQKKKCLYFSVVTWKWIKQRPHFVALKIASEVEPTIYTYTEPYPKYLKKENHKMNVVQNEETNENLEIKPYYIVPEHLPNSWKNQFKAVTRTLFLNVDKVIYTNPFQVQYYFLKILKLRGVQVFYECMDNNIYFYNNKEEYEMYEKVLIEESKKIIVSATGLKKMFQEKYQCPAEKITLVRNGYDEKTFKDKEEYSVTLQHPCATYVGTIDDWFDFDSIQKYAKKHPDFTFYLYGPVGRNAQTFKEKNKLKNICFMGSVEHKYVPSILEKSDIVLLPFIINSLIEDVDPVKMYEYLYMKKEVVSSYWEELNQFQGLVHFYGEVKDFESAMTDALSHKHKYNTKEYQRLMKESTWKERLIEYMNILKEEKNND